ncbi:MAG: hypothetical protein LBE08_03260 [Bifidobacteriaceae bacterium]|nr:hypothetical protein [Bifidobacteriaceae bacterium]
MTRFPRHNAPLRCAVALAFALMMTAQLAGCGTSDAPRSGSTDTPTQAPVDVVTDEPQAQDPQSPGDSAEDTETAPADDADTAQQGKGGWAVGDLYSGTCTVAWPTSPVFTATDVQMTMSCSGLSDSYLVVLVVYADPTLQVTPSTGAMHVTGEIYAFAETANLGGEYPIIVASAIEFS